MVLLPLLVLLSHLASRCRLPLYFFGLPLRLLNSAANVVLVHRPALCLLRLCRRLRLCLLHNPDHGVTFYIIVLAECVVQSDALYVIDPFIEEVYQVISLMIMGLAYIFNIGLTNLEFKEAPAGAENL
jgi:hypothetical protein